MLYLRKEKTGLWRALKGVGGYLERSGRHQQCLESSVQRKSGDLESKTGAWKDIEGKSKVLKSKGVICVALEVE